MFNLTHMQGEGACSRGEAAASWMWECSDVLVSSCRDPSSVLCTMVGNEIDVNVQKVK